MPGTEPSGRLQVPHTLIEARGLRAHPEATTLEVCGRGSDGRQHRLVPEAAAAWREVVHAAATAGVSLHIVSAFRSVDRQTALVERKLAAGQTLEDIFRVLAPPGYSEHHTGRAVDVGTPGCPPADVAFEHTGAFRWLNVHAAAFGFHLSYPRGNASGYQYEPWHWCYRPRA